MQKFWNWLVMSSANPEQVALTAKGLLTGLVPIALYFVSFLHLQVGSTELQSAVDIIGQIIIGGLGLISAVMTVYGFIRKLYLTFHK